MKFFKIALLLCFVIPQFVMAETVDIKELKKTVVNVEVRNDKFFGVMRSGLFRGTGFIVDKANGYIATNQHMVPFHPSQIKVVFIDGSSASAKRVYTDAFHDFSIIQYDPKTVTTDTEQVKLGDVFTAKSGDSVTLIGNNESEEYSVKRGEIVTLVKNKGDRHSQCLQTTFDRTGGSSGSPVWNEAGEVIAIHFKGSDTTSFELAINYVKDALHAIQTGKDIKRGDLGVKLGYKTFDEVIKYLNYPEGRAKELKNDNEGLKDVIMIDQIAPDSPSYSKLKPGDIVDSVDGMAVMDNLYFFDKQINQKSGESVLLAIFRRGELLKISIPVDDAEAAKINRFVSFAGGTFHEVDDNLRLYYDISDVGVYLSQVIPGSSLHEVGNFPEKIRDRRGVLIMEMQGKPIKNLDDLIAAIKNLKGSRYVTIAYKDFYFGLPPAMAFVELDLKTTPTQIFVFNKMTHDWMVQSL